MHVKQEILTYHLLIKSQSVFLCSIRKLGHKIVFSQFGTTVAYSIIVKCNLKHKKPPS